MTQSGLADALAAWLPAQRWFAGYGTRVRSLSIASDTQLANGDPEFRHLLIRVAGDVMYQVPVGVRARLPSSLAATVIGTIGGRVVYDALSDPELTAVLARGLAEQRVAGPLRFSVTPGATIDAQAPGRCLPPEQSNTSIVFGDQAILKVLRRPQEGEHPDLELPGVLTRSGSALVAAPLGWIEWAGTTGGGRAVLAVLSRYFPGASDGWSLAIASLRLPRPDFTDQARRLGQATAMLHIELAEAFGTIALSRRELAELSGMMNAELDLACAEVPDLRPYLASMRACYAEVGRLPGPVITQRIHGDYHLAQVLATDGGWVVLDFEGEPSVPLTARRAHAPALRDVAGMLRSFDYAARHQLHHEPADQRLRATALDWARHASDAFCAGYALAAGADPRASGPLLRALIFAKSAYEAVYEARHRPGWLPIPLSAIAEAAR